LCAWIVVGETMEIIHFDLRHPIQPDTPLVACIGYFDGLHVGHRQLITHVLAHAKAQNAKPALITFEPDPWAVIKQMDDLEHLTPMHKRIEIAEELGIETWIILTFEKDMQQLRVEDFHELVLKPLKLKTLVCGYDFHYGYRGEGNSESLKKQPYFTVDVVAQVSSDAKKISSSRIEELLRQGNIEQANVFLQRPYELEGIVVKGNQFGRRYGFPTANLKLSYRYVIPAGGVYIGEVKVQGRWYEAIINIGHNPTYNYQKNISIEAHLLDFDTTIYEQRVIFRFLSYLRKEEKFSDAQALQRQLAQDKQVARKYFQERVGEVLCD